MMATSILDRVLCPACVKTWATPRATCPRCGYELGRSDLPTVRRYLSMRTGWNWYDVNVPGLMRFMLRNAEAINHEINQQANLETNGEAR